LAASIGAARKASDNEAGGREAVAANPFKTVRGRSANCKHWKKQCATLRRRRVRPGLPVSAVIAQRFRLPSVDPTEFPEMIRLQIEKLLPFPADEVTRI